MKIFCETLRKNRTAIFIFVIFSAVDFAVFTLYRILLEPLWYAIVLSAFFLAVVLVTDCVKEKKRQAERYNVLCGIKSNPFALPAAETLAEKDYQQMVITLGREMQRMASEFDEERQDTLDYYTTWIHQMKTPIAVLKLKFSEDTPQNREFSAELFRIEQYAEMVLQYIRLGSTTNDLLIREYSLDEMIRETVRKFAPQFIGKKLKLSYTPTEQTTVTDKKWFLCILEQILSNAVKYTPQGAVAICVQENFLLVSDTGIGIAKEDLPRIFEKGYTGNNGRIGEKSSGLGLYLAQKAAKMLAISLKAESIVGKGTTFFIELKKY